MFGSYFAEKLRSRFGDKPAERCTTAKGRILPSLLVAPVTAKDVKRSAGFDDIPISFTKKCDKSFAEVIACNFDDSVASQFAEDSIGYAGVQKR